MREGSQGPRDFYLQANGLRIHYWDEGQGEPVLLIHGFGASRDFWRWNFEALAKHFRVVAFDLPGHGKSEKRLPGFSHPAAAEFLAAFLDSLGIEKAHVVGKSLGGALALALVLHHPEKVGKLVLVDSGGLGQGLHWIFRLLSIPILGRVLYRPLNRDQLRRLIRKTPFGAVDEEYLEAVYRAGLEPGIRETVLALARIGADWRGQKREMWEPLVRRLGEIEAPTLIVWGAQDPLVPVSHAYRAARLIPCARLKVFERCGHFPNVQYPEDFNKVVVDFLSADG